MLGRKKPEKAAGPKLRIFPAALEGYRFTLRNAGTALRLILVSAICMTGIHFALFGSNPPLEVGIDEVAGQLLPGLAELAATFLLTAMVMAAWQRRILLGPGNAKMRFGRRESRMLVALLGLGLMTVLTTLIAMLLLGVLETAGISVLSERLELVAQLVMAYFIGRFCFVLPARAVDRKLSFREAWRMTAGHGRDLMFVVVLVGIPVALLSELVLGVNGAVLENGALAVSVASYMLDSMLDMLDIVVTSAAMTFCYAALGGYQHILEARRAEAEESELAAAPT